jgi:hypothetical protein
MEQVARNATIEGGGYLNGCRYLLHDRDRSSATNFATRWRAGVRSARRYHSLRRVVSEFLEHYHPREKPPRQGQSFAFPHLCSTRSQCATCDPR